MLYPAYTFLLLEGGVHTLRTTKFPWLLDKSVAFDPYTLTISIMQLRALLLGLATTLSLATVATAASASATATSLKNKPSEAPHLKQITNVGCFNSSKGLEFVETLTYNTDGECGGRCQNKTYNVGATTGGSDCWCGNVYPPVSSLTDDTECNMPCTGYDQVACGGANAWSVYNTGVKLAVSNYEESSPSTVSTSAPTATSTGAAATSTTSSSDEDSGGSSKTVGIAVGVVAGILGVAAVVGGIVWYLRKKRNQEIEEEHRRNAAVNAFINGSNPPGSSAGSISMTDSRLDPVLAHRRLSDGSIADNEDYSRKILRVTNA